jgi:hypothetical protein
MRKRNFLVKVQNLPKQFGFEVEVKNLHFDERKAILAKNLVQGKTYITKLFFVFNLNDRLLEDNQSFHFGCPAFDQSFSSLCLNSEEFVQNQEAISNTYLSKNFFGGSPGDNKEDLARMQTNLT